MRATILRPWWRSPATSSKPGTHPAASLDNHAKAIVEITRNAVSEGLVPGADLVDVWADIFRLENRFEASVNHIMLAVVFGPAPRRKIAGRAARFMQQRDIGLSPTRHLHQFVPAFRALADIPAVRLRQEPHRRLRRDPGRTHSNASGQDPSRVIHTRSSMPYQCT